MFCRSLFLLLPFFLWSLYCLSLFDLRIQCLIIEEFEDCKGVIRIRKSNKDRQYNDQRKKGKRRNKDLQNITHKTCDFKHHYRINHVVNTFRFFPHSWLTGITEFVTRETRRLSLVKQELFTLPEHMRSPRFLVGFMLNSFHVLLYRWCNFPK
jgi:hypothetical protein